MEKEALVDLGLRFSGRTPLIFAVGIFGISLGYLFQNAGFSIALGVAGLALCVVALMLAALRWWAGRGQARLFRDIDRLFGADPTMLFGTDSLGQFIYRNAAARQRFGDDLQTGLAAQLQTQIAAPSAVMYRLQSRAEAHGAAQEDVVTRRGYLRLGVHVPQPGVFLWRLDEFEDRSLGGRGAETLSLPMVVANRGGIVLFSNEAMRNLLGERPKRLDRIFVQPRFGNGEEVAVQAAEGTVRAVVAEIDAGEDRREIFLVRLPEIVEPDSIPMDFENVPVGLMKFGADGGLRSANRAARELLGTSSVAALSFQDLFEDLGRPVIDWLGDVIAQRLPAGAEILKLRGEDESFVQVQLSRVVERGQNFALAILADVTALKRMEARFDQSQKMQAIGQLAGGIAHDFNNLLTAISGHCDLLLLRHGRDDVDFADLDQIHQNANRAASLVSQLLAYSRKQTLKPEQLDLAEVIRDMAHLLNRLVGERVSLQVQNDPALGAIRADRRRLEQVLMNLVVNARDAMGGKGRIRLETQNVTLLEPWTRGKAVLPAGRWAVIRVLDTGCGIPPDRIDKIFEPFFTTKRIGEGTGLGLSTVYGIVKQSGGYVFVESEPGIGSTFELMFPIVEGAVSLAPAPAPAPVAVDGGAREGEAERAAGARRPTPPRAPREIARGILLVEDEAPVRAFASRALSMQGYRVFEAGTGEEALELLADPTVEVDIFVTDVVMPGLDGPSWVRQALDDRPDVRVVFVSGYAEEHVNADHAKIANSIFLPKPFSLRELTETVQDLMR